MSPAKPLTYPRREKFQAAAAGVIDDLKALRAAPLVEQNYQGPVLFAPDAATDEVFAMIGPMVGAGGAPGGGRGGRGGPGQAAAASAAFSIKSRVLPAFLSVFDDPSMSAFQGRSLVGSYEIDDEGVRAAKVSVIENGQLVNYVLGRQPKRDFPDSTAVWPLSLRPGAGPARQHRQSRSPAGHAAFPGRFEEKAAGSVPRREPALLLLLRQGDFPARVPGLLYRVYVSETGARSWFAGACVFNEFDAHSLRNDLIAAGNDSAASNRDTAIPATVITPSLLFDDLELQRSNDKGARLPEYALRPAS